MHFEKEQDVLRKVVIEAWNNPAFKQSLMADPVTTIESFTGEKVELPEGKTLRVFDQSDENIVCLNIPVKPTVTLEDVEDVELTDEQLEVVAGGGVAISVVNWKKIPPLCDWPIIKPKPGRPGHPHPGDWATTSPIDPSKLGG